GEHFRLALKRCRGLAHEIESKLRNKNPEHFVDQLSLADLYASLQRASLETMVSRPILRAWRRRRAVILDMLFKPDAGADLGHDRCEGGLAALRRTSASADGPAHRRSAGSGEIVARTAVEPHLRALLAGNDAEAVVLDLVQPLAAGGQISFALWAPRKILLAKSLRI